MKPVYALWLLIAIISTGCEKDQISRRDIMGTWLVEKRHIDTLTNGRITNGSTIFQGNIKYIINSSDTLTICSLEDNYCSEFWMNYKPPGTISYDNCPLNMNCFISMTLEYEILRATHDDMVWKREYKYTSEVNLAETVYFKRMY